MALETKSDKAHFAMGLLLARAMSKEGINLRTFTATLITHWELTEDDLRAVQVIIEEDPAFAIARDLAKPDVDDA
jgi:hypothetical protein